MGCDCGEKTMRSICVARESRSKRKPEEKETPRAFKYEKLNSHRH